VATGRLKVFSGMGRATGIRLKHGSSDVRRIIGRQVADNVVVRGRDKVKTTEMSTGGSNWQGLRPHLIPLAITSLAILLGQIAVLTQHPLATTIYDDGKTYVDAASAIMASPRGLVQTFRTPGYPLLIATVFGIFGTNNFNALVVVQSVLAVISVFECYTLAYLLTRQQWAACIAATAVALDIYIVSWERTVLTESLSYVIVLTMLLIFDRLVRRPKATWAILLGLCCFWSIMVRPANVFLPPILFVSLLLWALWRRQLLTYVKPIALSAAVLGASLVGYMAANAAINGFFGLSDASNRTLLGKVIEFRMVYFPVPIEYSALEKDLQQFIAANPSWAVPEPAVFGEKYGSALGDNNGEFRIEGAYAKYVIEHHPVVFAHGVLVDMYQTWMQPPMFYAQYGIQSNGKFLQDTRLVPIAGINAYAVECCGLTPTYAEPVITNALLVYSTILEEVSYALLPILLLLAAFFLWRRKQDESAYLRLVVLLAVVGCIFLAAAGNYEEFYRIRSPLDWAMVLATVIVIYEVGAAILRRTPEVATQATAFPSTTPSRAQAQSVLPVYGLAYPPTALGGGTEEAEVSSPSYPVPTRGDEPTNTTRARWGQPMSQPPQHGLYFSDSASAIQSTRGVPTDLSELETGKMPTGPRPEIASYGSPYPPFPEYPEISIVLPCLNEEKAIGSCIDTLQRIIAQQELSAEIVVVDNASTDRSAEIARAHGARVVYQPVRGYGNAYLKGFVEARGTYIVMADADNTYDLSEVNDFVQPLREGYDLVMGNRFAGRMAPGAMTFSHRYIGNPVLSGILRFFFGTTVRDSHCGMRAFTRAAYPRMRLRTGGMEFASEMVINAAKAKLKITERSIGYAPRIGESKLHTVRDGWRHLRFMLLYSPTHLFLLPGLFLLLVGLGVEGALTPGPLSLFGHAWDVHTMLLASVVALLGVQIIMIGLFARFFSLTEELDGERDRVLQIITRWFTLERGLLVGGLVFTFGFAADAFVLGTWVANGMGQLALIRPTVIGSTLLAIGAEIIFGSFFLSFLQFSKTLHDPAAPLEDAASVRIPEPTHARH
jgi:4-amino-4-deoxy-L-arabinose transferase-like glycosyltransferase